MPSTGYGVELVDRAFDYYNPRQITVSFEQRLEAVRDWRRPHDTKRRSDWYRPARGRRRLGLSAKLLCMSHTMY